MGLVDSFIDGVDEFFRGIRDFSGASTESYIDLEAAASAEDHILQCSDGSCVSLIEWSGTHRLIGNEEFASNVEALAGSLRSNFAKTGHVIEVMFGCDRSPQHADRALDSFFKPMFATARRLRLDMDDVLEDRKRAMGKFCAPEFCYLALWTRPTILHAAEIKSDRKRHTEATKDLPRGKRAQYLMRSPQSIIDAHRSFVEFFSSDIKKRDISVNVLNARAAITCLRRLIDDSFTDEEYSPHLPGDPMVAKEQVFGSDDPSYLLWPTLSSQLVPREPVIPDLKCVQIGDRIWAPLVVTLPQKQPQPFQVLFNRLRSTGVSWRFKITISGNGLDENSFNQSMASMLTLGNATNEAIAKAYSDAKDDANLGNPRTALRMMAAVWTYCSPKVLPEERAKLSEASARLARAIQGWGSCDVTETTGNPALGFFCTMPAVRLSSIAPPSNPPLIEALKLLPWSRPASPWSTGHYLYRSVDGKPFPYAAFTAKQDSWMTLAMSGMGGGKSVLLNGLNTGLVLDPTNDNLPLIRILDVGPSSSGFTSLISSALGPERAHMSQYRRLMNTEDYSINPADTPLGQRIPLPGHRGYLVATLALLATPIGDDNCADGIVEIAGRCVDAAFQQFADTATSKPRMYSPASDRELDQAIAKHRIAVDTKTSYWELEDAFMKAGDERSAYRAHRLAMPLLAEIASMSSDPAITNMYPDQTQGGIQLTMFFRRKVLEAVDQYKILSRSTRFTIGEAAIVSLDLDEVCKRGSPAEKRQTQVMYSLALWALSSDFFMGEENLPYIHPLYLKYHAARVKMLSTSKKRLVADEFHRLMESSKAAVGVIEQIVREGRKWQVEVMLASQRFEDFPKSIVDVSSVIYILKPPMSGAEQMREMFTLTDTDIDTINTHLKGPVPGVGANLFAKFLTKEGNFSHLLTNTSGPIEMWAFSTTKEDANIRDTLYKEMESSAVRRLLARKYPAFVKGEIERRSALRANSGLSFPKTVTEEILDELRALARKEGALP